MKTCMWYSFCQLFKNKLVTIITTVMLAVGMILTCYAGVTYARFHHSEIVARKIIDYDVKDIYNINFFKYIYALSEEKNSLKELYYYIKGLPEVEFCGFYYYGEDVLYITPDLARMCGIYIDADENTYNAWSGENTRDVYPAGSYFYDSSTEQECIVKGVLEEDSYFPGDDFIDSVGDIIRLDNYILIDLDKTIELDIDYITNGIINNFYFYVPDSENIENIKQDIRNRAGELKLDVYVINSLDSMFEKNAREAMNDAGERYYMPITVLLCSCAGLLIATMISYRINKRDTNIMLLNGFTRNNLILIFLLENVYKTIAAYIISVIYWYNNENAVQYTETVNLKPLLVMVGITGFMLIFISSLPLIIKFKLKTPISLLGEE